MIFIRDFNARGQEISGYIDYAHRLKTEDFEPYFAERKKLLPRPSDLRYLFILSCYFYKLCLISNQNHKKLGLGHVM